MSKRSPVYIFIAALSAAVLIAGVFMFLQPRGELVLRDADSGAEYARFRVGRSAEFSVTFIHSVSNSPYTDYYEISREGIFLIGARYYEFGAGVPSNLELGESIEYLEDGSLRISGMRTPVTDLIYILGKDSDHILGLRGQKYSLKELCGEKKTVELVYE